MKKARILIHGEHHGAATGFSKMTREFCNRFHNAGYTVAELANYGHTSNIDRNFCKWWYYGSFPDPEERQEYESQFYNQFGNWRFDEVVLDFKPDYVLTFVDYWMATAAFNSPLRRFYKLGYIACVDSEPVKLDWLNQAESADDVFGYTDWTLEVLAKQSNIIKNRIATAPGADFTVYKPNPDKKKHREMSGVDPNWLIAGMVARNQKRKLFPDLFASLRIFLDKYGESHKELTDRVKLFIHTSMPDMGYDIPYLIKEYGLCNRVLVTYICKNCKHTFVSHFRGERTPCLYCKMPNALLPRVDFGVAENVLADVINLFDVYVQVCTNEGLGIPQLEAGACAVPVMSTDYSATSDVARKLKGYPLKVTQLFKEVETQAYKAVPDNNDLADQLFNFFSLPELERKKKGLEAKLGTIKHFNYDKTVKNLMSYIDKAEMDPNRWNESEQIVNIPKQIPPFNTFYDLTSWIMTDILGRPELINQPIHKRMIHELTTAFRYSGNGTNLYVNDNSVINARTNIEEMNVEKLINESTALRQMWNQVELRRVGKLQVPRKPYLDRAKPE